MKGLRAKTMRSRPHGALKTAPMKKAATSKVSRKRKRTSEASFDVEKLADAIVEAQALVEEAKKKTKTGRALDDCISELLEQLWHDGEGLHLGEQVLTGTQHFLKCAKGRLKQSWSLMTVWRRLEPPKRTPPWSQSCYWLSLESVSAWAGKGKVWL